MPPSKKNSDSILGPDGPRTVESVINGRLAGFLAECLPSGVSANPEQRIHNRQVDIVVEKPGAHKIYLEAKLTTLAKAKAHAQEHFVLMPSAKRPTHVGAICYSAAFHRLRAAENGEPLEFALLDKDSGEWSPAQELTAKTLAVLLASPGKIKAAEKNVLSAIQIVGNSLEEFANRIGDKDAQFAGALGMQLPAPSGDPKKHKEFVAARNEALKIGGLVITNAMMFSSALNHSIVATSGGKIQPYDGCAPGKLQRHWNRVANDINYVSILAPARRLIDAGECDKSDLAVLKRAADEIRPLAERGVDIIGRIFHTVLKDAKTYAAFFTGIPGATLMTDIALSPSQWKNVDWGDPQSIGKLNICDPACGSGTLIGLAAWKLRRNFRFKVGENRKDELRELQRLLVEKVIYAADIIPAAAHLAATSVALISPDVSFETSNVFRAPIGVYGNRPPKGKPDTRIYALGSLAHLGDESWLMEKDRIDNLGSEVEGNAGRPFPKLDVCLMNPPFVDSKQKDAKKFSFARGDADALMSKFRELADRKNFSPGYGQGPAFLTLAADKIKKGGRLALIIPSALATGGSSAWCGCRKVIEDRFNIEAMIISQDPLRPAFSDSTNFSELMLIARQNVGRSKKDDALFVVLHRNHCAPDALDGSREKAAEIAEAINEALEEGTLQGKVPGGVFKRMKWRGQPSWTGLNFVNFSLAMDIAKFSERGLFACKNLPTIPLHKVANFGNYNFADRQVVKHRLEYSKSPTKYGIYYPAKLKKGDGPGNKDNAALVENPHVYVKSPDGNGDWAKDFPAAAGRILVNMSFRFNTSRRLVSLVTQPVHGAHFHPVALHDESEEALKAMALWMNSTLVVAYTALVSSQTAGSKVNFVRGVLSRIPALDFRRLDDKVVKKLAMSFDRFIADDEVLQQFPQMGHDAARARLDNAVAKILGIDKDALSDLRRRLAREPIISNHPYSAE